MADADDPGSPGLRAADHRPQLRRVARSRGSGARHRRPGRGCRARRQGDAGAQRPPHRPRQAAGARLAGGRCRAPPPDREGPALRLQHPGGNRHRPRPAPLRRTDRLRCHRGLSVPRLRGARRPDPQWRGARRPARVVQALPQGHLQGPAEDPLEDGHLHRGLLPRRPAVRSHRPGRRGGRAELPRRRQPHSGRALRRHRGRAETAGARGVEQPQGHPAGRSAQVRPWWRIPCLQPGRGASAPGSRAAGRLCPLPRLHRAGRQPPGIDDPRPAQGQDRRAAAGAGGSRATGRHPQALRLCRYLPRRAVAGGT
ncbi:hypothetical protein D3C84_454200 [compost metagenome]